MALRGFEDQAPSYAWYRALIRPTAVLAVGSLLLLAGWLGWFLLGWTSDATLWILICGWGAVGIHSLAWASLGRAIIDAPREGSSLLRTQIAATFAASLLGFSVGLLTLPAAFPEPAGWGGILGAYLIFYGAFPYVPSVFAPVATAHAVIFLLVGRGQGSRRDSFATIAGSGLIIIVSLTGLVLQLAFKETLFPALTTPVWILAGLTSFGYVIVWRGLRREPVVPRARTTIVVS